MEGSAIREIHWMSFTVHNLFPIPVYHSNIGQISNEVIEYVENLDWQEGYTGDDHLQSDNKHLFELDIFSNIKQETKNKIHEYLFDVIGVTDNLDWNITTSWVNLSRPGDHMGVHWHANSIISGCIYLHDVINDGSIYFQKDKTHTNLWRDTFYFEFAKTTEYNTEVAAFNPRQGDILMFPSFLSHGVLLNEANTNRYSLAFNVFPKGSIGKNGNCELNLY